MAAVNGCDSRRTAIYIHQRANARPAFHYYFYTSTCATTQTIQKLKPPNPTLKQAVCVCFVRFAFVCLFPVLFEQCNNMNKEKHDKNMCNMQQRFKLSAGPYKDVVDAKPQIANNTTHVQVEAIK